MPTFFAPDGTELAYHLHGAGSPLICLPGGPMQDSEYLGDLGGLSTTRQLVMLDPRGTGASGTPIDTSSYRCDRLVEDLEALRAHLELDRFDLLGHSAGTNLAISYAIRHPERIDRLVLVTPSPAAVGIEVTGDARVATARLRGDEPWFGASFAALEDVVAGKATAESWSALEPFSYGRWDAAAQAHQASHDPHRNDEAAAIFGSEGAFDPPAARAALVGLTAPVLLLAGEFDLNTPPVAVAEFAGLFPNAELVVQSGAGHFPWVDDPARLAGAVEAFLSSAG